MRRCLTAATLLAASAALAQEAPPPPAPPRAAPQLLVAAKLGLWEPFSRLGPALYTAVDALYVIPALEQKLSVGLELSWTRPKYSGTITDPQLLSTDNSFKLGAAQFGVALIGVWRFPDAFAQGFSPYLGGGPGLYWHRAAITAFAENTLEKEAKIGFALLGGAEYLLGPGVMFAELQGRLARVDFITTGFSNLGGVAISAGYRFGF
jgi:opacity protein-like surface antigen